MELFARTSRAIEETERFVTRNSYVLRGKTPVPCTSLEELVLFEKEDGHRVALTRLGDKVQVSTVFLGIDHNYFGIGPPILFETMVFYKRDVPRIRKSPFTNRAEVDDVGIGNPQIRYATWDEAEAGHRRVVALVEKNMEHMTAAAAIAMDDEEEHDDEDALLH
jgi:hypothetical protein